MTIAGSGSALIAYVLIERRISQRGCPHCRFRVSVAALEEQCPRCGSSVRRQDRAPSTTTNISRNSEYNRILPVAVGLSGQSDESTIEAKPSEAKPSDGKAGAQGGLSDWGAAESNLRLRRGSRRADGAMLAKITLIGLPLLVITMDTAVLLHSRGRRETDKAISLVQTSSSRIENFTVQQYLYATLYEGRKRGASVIIEGWRAWQDPGDEHSATVEFDFKSGGLMRSAVWHVNISTKGVTARTEEARNLSWADS